ncbi:MAG: S66 peptidase family protein [Longimicrobiales bacterium]
MAKTERTAALADAEREDVWLRPPRLREGDRVVLIAPAGPVTLERIRTALRHCRRLGLDPVVGASARARDGYLAGPDPVRAADLQLSINDPDVAAVWAIRGGYGTMRLLRQLDFAPLLERPKAFIGFSDNTALHLVLAQHGLVSFHAPHAGFQDFPEWTEDCFRRVLFRAAPAGTLPMPPAGVAPTTLRGGVAEGPLTGGNLSLLAAMCGTPHAMQARGKILVLEEVSEPVYRIDRMLAQLTLSGAIDGVTGLAFGQFTKVTPMRDQRPLSLVLQEWADTIGVPALANLPFGHVALNWTLPLGVRVTLDADAGTLEVLEPAVS